MQRNKVLVVDDDVPLRCTLEMILEEAGYEVSSAGNGEEALKALERSMPEVIVLDMKMPIMDGWQFAKRFRERYGHQAALLVNTASADNEARARSIEAEAYVSKPFRIDELLGAVERCVEMNHQTHFEEMKRESA